MHTSNSRPKHRHALSRRLALGTTALAAACSAHADATWTGAVSQDWNAVGNWSSSPSSPTGKLTVNTATGNYAVLSGSPTISPVDFSIGDGAGNSGRVDQSSGSLALAASGTNGNWMFVGTNTGTGTYNLTGDGNLTVGKLWVGGFVYGENGTGTVTVNTSGTLQANSNQDFSGWGQYQSSINVGWGSFPSGPANGTLNVVNGTVNSPNRAIYVGAWGSTGTLNQSGGTINANGLELGRWFSTLATANVTGGTLNAAFVNLANSGNGNDVSRARLNVSGSGVLNSEADLVVSRGGSGSGGSFGEVNVQTGGTVNVGSTVERWLVVNMYDTAPGTLNVTGGALNLNAGTDIRFSTQNSTAAGTVNLDSGTITGGAGSVIDLNNNVTGANNQFNLNGGTLTVGQILTNNDGGTATFNFNGGTLKAAGSTTAFLDLGGAGQTAVVKSGGAIIDTNGFDVTIAQALIAGAGGGGLTKNGTGVLTLSGANTFTGDITVNGGTLSLSSAFLDSSADVNLFNGSVLDLGFSGTNNIAYLFINGASQAVGTYGGIGSGATYELSSFTGTGWLGVTASSIPEPSSFAAFGGIAALAFAASRRRRSERQAAK